MKVIINSLIFYLLFFIVKKSMFSLLCCWIRWSKWKGWNIEYSLNVMYMVFVIFLVFYILMNFIIVVVYIEKIRKVFRILRGDWKNCFLIGYVVKWRIRFVVKKVRYVIWRWYNEGLIIVVMKMIFFGLFILILLKRLVKFINFRILFLVWICFLKREWVFM